MTGSFSGQMFQMDDYTRSAFSRHVYKSRAGWLGPTCGGMHRRSRCYHYSNLWTAGTSGADNAEIYTCPGSVKELRGKGGGTLGAVVNPHQCFIAWHDVACRRLSR